MHECISGKHRSPFIAQRVESDSIPESTDQQQQQQQQGQTQDPGHLVIPAGPPLSEDGIVPQADGVIAGGDKGLYGPPELGRASPR